MTKFCNNANFWDQTDCHLAWKSVWIESYTYTRFLKSHSNRYCKTTLEQPIFWLFTHLWKSYFPLTRTIYGTCTISYLHYKVRCIQTLLIYQSRLPTMGWADLTLSPPNKLSAAKFFFLFWFLKCFKMAHSWCKCV